MQNGFFKLFVVGITIVLFSALVALVPPIALADDRNSDIVVSKDNGDVSTFSQDKDNLMYDGKSLLALNWEQCFSSCVHLANMCKAPCLLSRDNDKCFEACDEEEKQCKEECMKEEKKKRKGREAKKSEIEREKKEHEKWREEYENARQWIDLSDEKR